MATTAQIQTVVGNTTDSKLIQYYSVISTLQIHSNDVFKYMTDMDTVNSLSLVTTAQPQTEQLKWKSSQVMEQQKLQCDT